MASPYLALQDTFRRNYVALFHKAIAEDIRDGRAWYAEANATATAWANASGRSVANVATLIAVLSPQCDWDRNLAAAFALLNGETPGAGPLPSSVVKAQRVLDEGIEDTRVVMPTGNKVAAFARNIAGDTDAVTVDTHMTEAAFCSPDRRPFPKDAAYRVLADAIRLAADECAEEPAVFQAIVWHVWKRAYAPAAKRNHRRS